jgi:hypothetical protein
MLNLDKFKKLFTPLPGNRYLQVSNQVNEISTVIQELMNK